MNQSTITLSVSLVVSYLLALQLHFLSEVIMKTVKNTTYFESYYKARDYALQHSLPTDRIISYGLGWAIQKHISGPYWSHTKQAFI